jgi:hypothetical protein
MIITNKLNMPEAYVKAIQNSRHNADKCLSATTLLKGTKEIILTDRHFDEIEVDAADEVWAVFGTAVHAILEHQEDEAFKEESFSVGVFDYKVTGKVDRYDMKNETIEDWKTASVWKVLYKDFDDWKKQGLIYAYLLKQSGLNVRHIRFIALLKDHSKTEAKRRTDYPQSPVYIYEFDVLPDELTGIEALIKAKVLEVSCNADKADDEIAGCTPSERWGTDPKFAVMKEGRKTAVKVCDTEEEALNFIEELEKDKDKHFVEERKGVDKKCEDYCPCAAFCSYYKAMHQNEQVTLEGEK